MRAIILAGISQLAISSGAFADNAVTRANEAMGMAMFAACQSPSGNPFHESRAYAMANLAIHDALNAIERKYQPYTYDKKAEAGTSANAAVASAAYHVMAPTTAKIPAEVLPNAKCLENAKAIIEGSYVSGADRHSRWTRRKTKELPWARQRPRPCWRNGRTITPIPADRSSTRPARRQRLPASINARQAPLRRFREMGKRHALRAERPYGISARSSLQGGRCQVQGRP